MEDIKKIPAMVRHSIYDLPIVDQFTGLGTRRWREQQRRLARGCCRHCIRVAVPGRMQCAIHLARARDRQVSRYARKRASELERYGMSLHRWKKYWARAAKRLARMSPAEQAAELIG